MAIKPNQSFTQIDCSMLSSGEYAVAFEKDPKSRVLFIKK
jgi:hypothetical protein